MADFILAQPTPARNTGEVSAKQTTEVSPAGSPERQAETATVPSTPLYQRLISYSSTLLVFLLAVGAFVLSYATLWDTALSYGLPPRLAWIWPLLVDFALVVFSLAVVRASLYGERTLWPWLMVALYTVATVAFNILHAPDHLAARVVAVVAPVSLFLSFETLMAMLKSEVKRKQMTLPLNDLQRDWVTWRKQCTRCQAELAGQIEQWQTKVEHLNHHLDEVNRQLQQKQVHLAALETRLKQIQPEIGLGSTAAQPERPRAEAKQAELNSIQARREQVSLLAAQGLSQVTIANRLGVSLSTVKRDLTALPAEPVQDLVQPDPTLRLNGRVNGPERSAL
jgi:DNA-binding CsgD family transcriptional regulator